MADYTVLINGIIEAVGGVDNVSSCWHCATRLRFQLKDFGLLKMEKLDETKGVIGKKIAGDQLQVIIGPNVGQVYDQLCRITGIKKEKAVDENFDIKEKLTIKNFFGRMVSAISECFVPLITIIVAASFIKLIAQILGPSMLNVISATSHLYILFNFVGDSGFYFLPVFMGATAAKRFGASQTLGMLAGAILLHPTLSAIVGAGETFTVYGIPMTLVSYANSTIPVLLTVWIMSYIEKFIYKRTPDSLKNVIVPVLTILIILPIELCIIGPMGTLIGEGLANAAVSIASLGKVAYVLVGTVIGGVFALAILFGTHVPLFMIAVGMITINGSDGLIITGLMSSVFALAGMEIAALLRFKDAENRSLVISYLVTHLIGGITEPAIFGIGVRYRRPLVCSCVGAAIGSLFVGITGAQVYTVVATSNVLAVTAFLGGTNTNFILGVTGLVISTVSSAIITYFFGFKPENLQGKQ